MESAHDSLSLLNLFNKIFFCTSMSYCKRTQKWTVSKWFNYIKTILFIIFVIVAIVSNWKFWVILATVMKLFQDNIINYMAVVVVTNGGLFAIVTWSILLFMWNQNLVVDRFNQIVKVQQSIKNFQNRKVKKSKILFKYKAIAFFLFRFGYVFYTIVIENIKYGVLYYYALYLVYAFWEEVLGMYVLMTALLTIEKCTEEINNLFEDSGNMDASFVQQIKQLHETVWEISSSIFKLYSTKVLALLIKLFFQMTYKSYEVTVLSNPSLADLTLFIFNVLPSLFDLFLLVGACKKLSRSLKKSRSILSVKMNTYNESRKEGTHSENDAADALEMELFSKHLRQESLEFVLYDKIHLDYGMFLNMIDTGILVAFTLYNLVINAKPHEIYHPSDE